jgi:hypothetical protein
MPSKPIPDGYRSVIPYLIVDGAAAAIEFYKTALGATERFCLVALAEKSAMPSFRSVTPWSCWPTSIGGARQVAAAVSGFDRDLSH